METAKEILEMIYHPERWLYVVRCPHCNHKHSLDHKARALNAGLNYTCPNCAKTVFFETVKTVNFQRVPHESTPSTPNL